MNRSTRRPLPKERVRDYQLKYPSYLDNRRLLWTTREGDIFIKDGCTYRVTQVVAPLLPGDLPRIVLKEENPTDATTNLVPF